MREREREKEKEKETGREGEREKFPTDASLTDGHQMHKKYQKYQTCHSVT